MGCPATGCKGYELFDNHSSRTDSDIYTASDLDFDTDGSGDANSGDAYWTGGDGWEPIGDSTTPFTAAFYGNGYGLRNLFIGRPPRITWACSAASAPAARLTNSR